MWRSRNGPDGEPVTCVACGSEVDREDAREYDKHGDRWERNGKSFEHLCKPCFRRECHQPRGELESLLVDLEAGDGQPQEEFISRYVETVKERYGTIEE